MQLELNPAEIKFMGDLLTQISSGSIETEIPEAKQFADQIIGAWAPMPAVQIGLPDDTEIATLVDVGEADYLQQALDGEGPKTLQDKIIKAIATMEVKNRGEAAWVLYMTVKIANEVMGVLKEHRIEVKCCGGITDNAGNHVIEGTDIGPVEYTAYFCYGCGHFQRKFSSAESKAAVVRKLVRDFKDQNIEDCGDPDCEVHDLIRKALAEEADENREK